MRFMDKLGGILNYSRMEDWYNITISQIVHFGGASLLKKFNDSPSDMVASIYNHHQWIESTFQWKSKERKRDFLDELGRKLQYQRLEDWYHATVKGTVENGGSSYLHGYGNSASKLIKDIYKSHKWTTRGFEAKLPSVDQILKDK